jgi:hypothetical protein
MMKKILLYLLGMFLLASCEEIVTLDLQKIDRQIVVEAFVLNPGGEAQVNLSYSQNFYDTLAFNAEMNAVVELVASNNSTIRLTHQNNGLYAADNIEIGNLSETTLRIAIDETMIEAKAAVPPAIPIANVIPVANPFWGKDSINFIVNYFDRKNEDNYFRVRVNKYGEERGTEFYLVDDSFGKNGLLSSPIYYKNFKAGDTVVVELYHMTKAMFTYFNGLSNNIGGSFNSIAPGNPVSNLPSGTMGYFAVFGYDADTLIAMPPL